MTTILAIDTTMGACSVALLKNNTLLAEMTEIRARGHVERLLPMIDELCEEAQFNFKELNILAVTVGPGTFAGVRIGLSVAKGIALALDIPIIPVTSLQAIAFDYANNNFEISDNVTVCVDTRRGEFYMQSFNVENGSICEIDAGEAIPLTVISEKVNGAADVIGSGAGFIEGQNTNKEKYQYPRAAMIAKFAASHLYNKMYADKVSPLYLRAPDANPSIKNVPLIKDD
jgi:tRNA threonylcarbamoyladenosine biosynthesis protein TsaB